MPPTINSNGGRIIVDVPWRQADSLHAYLRRNGIVATEHLDPASHTARIEPADGTDPHRLRFLVAQWRDGHPPG
jgi:hypothetical protein